MIIYVTQHKTASTGSARLRITATVTLELMENWKLLIRKVACDDNNNGTFLVRRNGQAIPSTDAAKECYTFGSMVHLWIPSPRISRKLSVTAADNLGDSFERSVVSHMSHSLQTSQKHYQSITSTTPGTIAC